MNYATWILMGELFLILVFLIIATVFFAWRKKKRLLASLDILLTKIDEAEPDRKTMLTGRLKDAYRIDEAKAQELSSEVFRSERRFIQKLIQLLLGSGIEEITKFNEDLYELSAPYWKLIPLDLGTANQPTGQISNPATISPTAPEPVSDSLPNEGHDLEINVTTATEENSGAEATLTEPVPDTKIGEAVEVDSSKATDRQLPKQDQGEEDQSENTNQLMPVAAEEHTDEPTWNDAFDQAAQERESSEINLNENETREISEPETPSQ